MGKHVTPRKSDRYKTKACAQCENDHKKRGKFCSRACYALAKRGKKYTPEMRANMSVAQTKLHAEGESGINQALAVAQLRNRQRAAPADADIQELQVADILVQPTAPRLPLGYFEESGDIWQEVDDW